MHRFEHNLPLRSLYHAGPAEDVRDLPEPASEQSSKTVSDQDQFLCTVTQNIKSGLRALKELPSWVEDDLQEANIEVPRPVQEHLRLMQKSARGLSELIDGLTELSNIGRHPDAPHRCTVEQAARRAWMGLSKNQAFTLETHDALDTIFLPERAVETVFKSILENTLHHHDQPKGHVTVTSQTAGNRVLIRVEDDGPGLEPGVHRLVFDAFFTMRSREMTGRAGLGLTIAKKLVGNFGGKIELAEASNGRGLSVQFDLPIRERW